MGCPILSCLLPLAAIVMAPLHYVMAVAGFQHQLETSTWDLPSTDMLPAAYVLSSISRPAQASWAMDSKLFLLQIKLHLHHLEILQTSNRLQRV